MRAEPIDHPAHRLDTAGDHDVLLAGADGLGGEVDGLLAGAALAVDRGRGHVGREAGAQPGHPAGRRGLLADLGDAADDDVVDVSGVEGGAAAEQRLESLGEQVDGVHVGQGCAGLALTDGSAHGVDHDHVAGVC